MNNKKNEVLNKLTGPDGYRALILSADKSIEDRRNKISTLKKVIEQYNRKIDELNNEILKLQGAIDAFERVSNTLKQFSDNIGLSDLYHNIQFDKETHEVVKVSTEIINPEIKERKEKNQLCMYRDDETKKWCNRKLRSKEDKRTGYCKIHRDILLKDD